MTEWLTRRSVFTGAIVLWLAFIPLLIWVPRQAVFEVLNAVAFAVSTGVVVGYSTGIVRVLQRPIRNLDSGDALRVGVIIGWAATAVVFGVLWWWRITGKEDEVIDSVISAMSRWVLITAGAMHLAASGSIDGHVPLKSYLRAGVIVALGLFMGTGLIMWLGIPDPRPR